MLQTETYMPAPQLSLFTATDQDQDECPSSLCPLPQEMLEIFEQMTGWVVRFNESKSSYRHRQLPSMIPQLASGDFEITDMSAHWPAQKPTAHRGKCDQFVGFLNALVTDLHQTRCELASTQSILESYAPGSVEDDDTIVSDSFIPRYSDKDRSAAESELATTVGHSENNHAVDPPFDGWRLDGAPGFVDGKYVDWKLSEDECINLIIGQVETPEDPTEAEAILKIDPLTNEYFLSGDAELNFLIYDQRNRHLTRVEPTNRFRQLKPSQMIILSTSNRLTDFADRTDTRPIPDTFGKVTKRIADFLGDSEHYLVLKREANAEIQISSHHSSPCARENPNEIKQQV